MYSFLLCIRFMWFMLPSLLDSKFCRIYWYLPQRSEWSYTLHKGLPWWLRQWRKESEVTQSWPTLYNHMDCSLPGSSIHGIFQAWILEWVAISFSRGSSQNQGSCDSEESTFNEEMQIRFPGSGRSPEEENGNPLQIFAWRIPWTEEPDRR